MESFTILLKPAQSIMLSNYLRKNCFKNQRALLSLSAKVKKFPDALKMNAWQIHSYEEDLQLSSTRKPFLRSVDSILVKVESVSVNPIDLYMKDGYARNVLNVFRNDEMELPLTLGRDFSGTIVRKGLTVDEKYKIGDKVYGFIPLHKQGSFAEYVIAENGHFRHQPDHLSPAESASMVYASMTAWSALFVTAGLALGCGKDKRILILGASGGVGTMAVQLLKSQGVHVAATCATDAMSLVRSLGADDVFDYTQPDHIEKISTNRYDIILDCAKFGIDRVPNEWKFGQYITLNSPLILNTDEYGLVGGLMKSTSSLLSQNIMKLKDGKRVKWGFFIPSNSGFELIDRLAKNNQLRPVIHKEFSFEQLPTALNEVKKGHLRGKVMINI
ncbi:reticulon-4-interacting protein 1 homolog, mitochondrial-like [Coccinella septempunctata]|uniref:reticulon-4-interacting protein 1 homolog, mitochondrial-like n=1 Tax=Coccinella septempunctata TaxID=41139 RepID=UPI001D0817BB|nr:reticulon-4-interacting protein 1 homolog, mitochondrial-like [Coccinella septempunctata]